MRAVGNQFELFYSYIKSFICEIQSLSAAVCMEFLTIIQGLKKVPIQIKNYNS